MKKDKYYWLNRASKHHIDRLRVLISDLPDSDEILSKGNPRYIYHIVDEVKSEDGHRLYQFLIEYDIYNPTQGIYFGCKSITRKPYRHSSETQKAIDDWLKLRPKVTRRLNNIFPDSDFTFRFKDPDNDNDYTFWPFWIELYETESPVDFAIPVLRKIADIYRDKNARETESPNDQFDNSFVYPSVATAFSKEAYKDFRRNVYKKVKEKSTGSNNDTAPAEAWIMTEKFISAGESTGLFIRCPFYDYAWLVRCPDIEFKALLTSFFSDMSGRLHINSINVPWSNIIRLFLRYDETPYKIQLKTMNPKNDTIDKIKIILKEMLG